MFGQYLSILINIRYCVRSHILPIDCLLIALDTHMFSHNGYSPGARTKAQKLLGRGLGARSFWAVGLGPAFVYIMAAHVCIKGNHAATDRQ